MSDPLDIVVVGAGQAGLSLSHELSSAGVEHVVLERGRVGETWRGRWDSFRLVFPNWTVRLPGSPYAGSDPDGYMHRDEVVDHLAAYAAGFRAPVEEGVSVSGLAMDLEGRFLLETSRGRLRARQVVLACGAYQKPHRPQAAERIPPSVRVLDAEDYASPELLPPGPVLVVGSGQTGCQLAEEIAETGAQVYLACGHAPWLPRRLGGRDIAAWLEETPFWEQTVADLPSPVARLQAAPQASGSRGGHDLHYRTLQASGVTLLGRFIGVRDGAAHFTLDLAESVAFGDARYAELCAQIRESCLRRGLEPPEMPPPPPFAASELESLDLAGFGAVIFTSGYRPDYATWVKLPEAFDDLGFPIQADGSSTAIDGLHFMGVHFQRKRKSATLLGVAEDAAVLAERMAGSRRR